MGGSLSSPVNGSLSTKSDDSSYFSSVSDGRSIATTDSSPQFSDARRSTNNSARWNFRTAIKRQGNEENMEPTRLYTFLNTWLLKKTRFGGVIPKLSLSSSSQSETSDYGTLISGRSLTSTDFSDENLSEKSNANNNSQISDTFPSSKFYQENIQDRIARKNVKIEDHSFAFSGKFSTKRRISQQNHYRTLTREDKDNNNDQFFNKSNDGDSKMRIPTFVFPFYNAKMANRLPFGSLSANCSQQTNVDTVNNNYKSRNHTNHQNKKAPEVFVAEPIIRNVKKQQSKQPHELSQFAKTNEPLLPPSKTIIQASTSQLLKGLGNFISLRCMVNEFESSHVVNWLRTVDRALILQGWQEIAFINPANLVFVYMLIRNHLAFDNNYLTIRTLDELHTFVLECLYIAYSYMGNEISYPLKPFVTARTNRENFWSCCVKIIQRNSEAMLRLNSSSTFFLEVFLELKNYSIDS